MIWLTILKIVTAAAIIFFLLLLVWTHGWRKGYLKGVEWFARLMLDNMDDMNEIVKQYAEDNIPPDIKARLAELRGEGKPKPSGVKAETMAEIRKLQDAKNGNASEERQQQPD